LRRTLAGMILLLLCIPAVFVIIAVVVIPFLILGTLRDIHRELQTANRGAHLDKFKLSQD
jgi:uncharacterized membrane protein